MGLDRFGYPATHMANSVLVGLDDFGDTTKQLESSWFEWLNYYPFDAEVGEKLATLYQKRLETMDAARDADRIQKLTRKLVLTENRTGRYTMENFVN